MNELELDRLLLAKAQKQNPQAQFWYSEAGGKRRRYMVCNICGHVVANEEGKLERTTKAKRQLARHRLKEINSLDPLILAVIKSEGDNL